MRSKKPSKKAIKVVQDALNAIDWEVFWREVDRKVEPQVEAYRRARILSYANAHKHVFYG